VQRERVGAHSIHPPRPEPLHQQCGVTHGPKNTEAATGYSQHKALEHELTTNLRRAKSNSTEQADLAHALFDTELEEEGGQQQRRDHEEETEVDEVSTKVGGPTRSGDAIGPDISHDQPHRQRIDHFRELSGVPRTCVVE
jgi:hypothetical protein